MDFLSVRRRPFLALAIVALLFAAARSSRAAYIKDYPVTLTQPDGTAVRVLLTGDEFYNWAHDADGYVIVRHPANGRLVYAREVNGEVAPTDYVVNKANPRFVGLVPNIAARHASLARSLSPITQDPAMRRGAPRSHNSGSFNNIVIYIRFADEAPTNFAHPLSAYDTMLNGDAGTNSLRNYYKEVSFNTLTINSVYYPTQSGSTIVSFQDTHARAYYKPYDATTNPTGYQTDSGTREHNLLRAAIAGVKPTIDASGIVTDSDNDGYVDNVVFVVDGDVTAWATLLWPHMWTLGNGPTLGGATVGTYNFQLDNYVFSYGGVGVFCHEMFHSLGAPDLYHYSYDGFSPAGKWDIMEANQEPPQHMTAYMKWKYGTWINSIPEITESGHYTLNPTTSSTNNCYKIRSLASSTQYFVVEYRRKGGVFENSVPGSGLLVYRIDTTAGDGNANGPPDELYIYRPNGTPAVNGDIDRAFYTVDAGRTAINSTTNPTPFLQNGNAGALDIQNVSKAGTTISFDINISYPPATRVGFITQPGTTKPGSLIVPQPEVAALSDSGVVNATVTGPVTVSLKPDSGTAGATLGGTLTLNMVKGRAVFTDLTVDLQGAAYILTASSPGLASGDSAAFSIGYLAELMSITTQPAGAEAGKPLLVQPVVQLSDAQGHLATTFYGQVSVALKAGTGTAGAVLSGWSTVGAVAGIASFSGLQIDKPGTGYVLRITSGTMPAVETLPFDVVSHLPAVIRVNKNASGAAHDGATWDTAYTAVQSAIGVAVSGDEVWVAASTAPYVEKIAMKAGVPVYGGFAGTETARAQRDWRANATVLDGSGATYSAEVSSSAAGAVLDGFAVRNCTNGYPAVFVTGGSIGLANCNVSGNTGRGISVSSGAATVMNSAVTGNGYGIYVSGGTAKVTNCVVSGNTYQGLYGTGGTATVANCILAFNDTGVYRLSTSLTLALSHNDVYGNTTANYSNTTDVTGTGGNISADPLFANAATGDFHLTSGSPCIDAGDDGLVTAAELDMGGTPRISGLHVDMGAFEYGMVAPYTLSESVTALKIAGGLLAAGTSDLARLNVDTGAAGIDIADALRIARKAGGVDSNP